MDTPRQIVITLVHGTWAKRATWVRPVSKKRCSTIRSVLLGSLNHPVVFKVFRWSGKNSISARIEAATSLAERLTVHLKNYPNAHHFVIAHSHGGNVALRAVIAAGASESISLVFLATPFISITPRNLGGLIPIYIIHAGILIALLLALMAIGVALIVNIHALHKLYAAIALFAFAFSFFAKHIRNFVFSAPRRATEIVQRISLTMPPYANFMILRHAGDEASLFLNTAQTARMLLTTIIRLYVLLIVRLRGSIGIDVVEPFHLSPLMSLRAGLATLFAFRVDVIHNSKDAILPWGTVANSILVAGVIALSIPLLPLMLMMTLAASVVLLLPLVFTVIVLGAVPLGFDLIRVLPYYEINVQETPPGSYVLNNEASLQTDGLIHSAIYDNPAIIGKIAVWIDEQCHRSIDVVERR